MASLTVPLISPSASHIPSDTSIPPVPPPASSPPPPHTICVPSTSPLPHGVLHMSLSSTPRVHVPTPRDIHTPGVPSIPVPPHSLLLSQYLGPSAPMSPCPPIPQYAPQPIPRYTLTLGYPPTSPPPPNHSPPPPHHCVPLFFRPPSPHSPVRPQLTATHVPMPPPPLSRYAFLSLCPPPHRCSLRSNSSSAALEARPRCSCRNRLNRATTCVDNRGVSSRDPGTFPHPSPSPALHLLRRQHLPGRPRRRGPPLHAVRHLSPSTLRLFRRTPEIGQALFRRRPTP